MIDDNEVGEERGVRAVEGGRGAGGARGGIGQLQDKQVNKKAG